MHRFTKISLTVGRYILFWYEECINLSCILNLALWCVLASSPGPIFILKLAGTKNRAWYPLARSWCACASHSPESGESCTVVLWFVIFSVYLFGSPRKLYLVPDRRICVARGFA